MIIRHLLPAAVAACILATANPSLAQAPAAPTAPAATPAPAPLPPPTFETLDPLVQVALDAYGSGQFAKFFSVYVGTDIAKPDAAAFNNIVGPLFKNFGRYTSRTFKPAWSDLASEEPRLAYSAKFEKVPATNMFVRFKRVGPAWKILELSLLDSTVNN